MNAIQRIKPASAESRGRKHSRLELLYRRALLTGAGTVEVWERRYVGGIDVRYTLRIGTTHFLMGAVSLTTPRSLRSKGYKYAGPV